MFLVYVLVLGYLNPIGPPAFVQACFSVFGVCYFVDFIFPNSFVLMSLDWVFYRLCVWR
jgi:hypothetical protein